VDWKGEASYIDKDKIEYIGTFGDETITKVFEKYECLDVEMNWEIHHEVQLNLIIDCNNKKTKI